MPFVADFQQEIQSFGTGFVKKQVLSSFLNTKLTSYNLAMKEACPLCGKDNYVMPGLPSHLKTHPHEELVNYILRKTAEERGAK